MDEERKVEMADGLDGQAGTVHGGEQLERVATPHYP
jgi:hypothetical protein